MTARHAPLPDWALDVLATPGSGQPLRLDGTAMVDGAGQRVGEIADGIARFDVAAADPSIDYYRAVGGARFSERAAVPLAMTSLDTSIYHGYLEDIAPPARDAVIVDVGGGDGRNVLPWLRSGMHRVVLLDPVADALARARAWAAREFPDRLDRLLLVEADARALPLATGVADSVIAVEALCYLNEDYPAGLAECGRCAKPGARLLIADRDYEASLLARLFYFGLPGMLDQAAGRSVIDGNAERTVRSRCFTRAEFEAEIVRAGLTIDGLHGISGLSLIIGYLRQKDALTAISPDDVARLRGLLQTLGRSGSFVRAHVAIAHKPAAP